MKGGKIFIAGHRGLVGSALVRVFKGDSKYEIITRTRQELDLMDAPSVAAFFDEARPQGVIIAAAKVGGIHANNTYPVDFLLDNLKIQNNLIENAHRANTQKLLFLGSSCIYPKFADQPIQEQSLLAGKLEPTNEAYAIAKIAGIKLCQAYARQYDRKFISAMPTNLYGPHDNFDLSTSHVLPALIRRFHEAKINGDSKVTCWGTGQPRREFLHVDDLASACKLLFEEYEDQEIINVGTGEDLTIKQLAETIARVVGFKADIEWDTSKPDGTPRKLLDVSKLQSLGWSPKISLEDGIRDTYEWYRREQA